jgi:hypothetical protein
LLRPEKARVSDRHPARLCRAVSSPQQLQRFATHNEPLNARMKSNNISKVPEFPRMELGVKRNVALLTKQTTIK